MFEITLDDIKSKLNDKNSKTQALIAATRNIVNWLIKNAPNPRANSIKFKSQSSSFSMVVSVFMCWKKERHYGDKLRTFQPSNFIFSD